MGSITNELTYMYIAIRTIAIPSIIVFTNLLTFDTNFSAQNKD